MLDHHISFDDHPMKESRNNHFSTVTVISIVHYMKNNVILYKISKRQTLG